MTLVCNLCELFDQIDVNGDGTLEWEEFTGFCVEAGLVATRRDKRPLNYKYEEDIDYADVTSKGTYVMAPIEQQRHHSCSFLARQA